MSFNTFTNLPYICWSLTQIKPVFPLYPSACYLLAWCWTQCPRGWWSTPGACGPSRGRPPSGRLGCPGSWCSHRRLTCSLSGSGGFRCGESVWATDELLFASTWPQNNPNKPNTSSKKKNPRRAASCDWLETGGVTAHGGCSFLWWTTARVASSEAHVVCHWLHLHLFTCCENNSVVDTFLHAEKKYRRPVPAWLHWAVCKVCWEGYGVEMALTPLFQVK